MRLDLSDAPTEALRDDNVTVGDVYQHRGGPGARHLFWVVVGKAADQVYVLSIDARGEIVGASNYGIHVFERRTRIGRVRNLHDLSLQVDWS